MARIVVVHGIGHDWSGPALMGRDVGPAPRDGVRLGSRRSVPRSACP
ncbi:hypothetical protein ACFWMJ_02285 [Streptomyces hawaiiensis]